MKYKDLTGQKFGKLSVVSYSHTSSHRDAHWTCLCDCDNSAVVKTYQLKSGKTKSCGCLQKEAAAKIGSARLTTHGLSKTLKYKKDMSRKTHLMWAYGITPEKKDELRLLQNYECKICKKSESQLGYELYVDHDHVTEEIRDYYAKTVMLV